MKIKTDVSAKWVKWFAWHPVKTEEQEWVWLETVERKIYNALIPNVVPSSWTIYRRIR